ncbi:ATP synthase subunit I [Tautonia marina]|uniref:ATP synthase subunit I n=1 Tax=Tautonia marina TaxID=2653855 RepID=UPI00191C619A|nr:ATP synthase subunit I [Tautonia marina]
MILDPETVVPLILAFTAGGLIGAIAFGGLWLTVRRLPTSRRPGLLLLGSFVGRLGICLPLIFVVMGGHWERLAACLVGLLAVRTVMIRRWGPDRVPARMG